MKFRDYDHVLEWIERKSREYGSKNKFYASDEYKNHYPIIKSLHASEHTKYKTKAERAMREAKTKSGDKVRYDLVSPWGHAIELKGTITMRKGIPYVKLDQSSAKIVDRKTLRWHKGFRKY